MENGASFIRGNHDALSTLCQLSERIIIIFNCNLFLIFVASMYEERIYLPIVQGILLYKVYNNMRIFMTLYGEAMKMGNKNDE